MWASQQQPIWSRPERGSDSAPGEEIAAGSCRCTARRARPMLSRSWLLCSEVFSSRIPMPEVGEAPRHRAPLWHHRGVLLLLGWARGGLSLRGEACLWLHKGCPPHTGLERCPQACVGSVSVPQHPAATSCWHTAGGRRTKLWSRARGLQEGGCAPLPRAFSLPFLNFDFSQCEKWDCNISAGRARFGADRGGFVQCSCASWASARGLSCLPEDAFAGLLHSHVKFSCKDVGTGRGLFCLQ